MAYTKTTWTNDTGEPIDADNLNKIEQGIFDADAAATAASAAAAAAVQDADMLSQNLAHTPSHTDATATTTRAKLDEFVSVLDFGATGDGATDDSAAFTKVIAANGTVHVPPGTYSLGTNISLSGHWVFSDGAKIQADATVTLTGSITAGEFQIAEHGSGTVVWNIDHPIRAAWFGLLTSNSAAENATAWNNFISAQSYSTDYVVEIGRGTFSFSAPFYLPQRMDVIGLKQFGTILSMEGSNEHGVEVCYVNSGTITYEASMAGSPVYIGFRRLNVFCNNMTFTGGTKKFMFYGAGMSSSVVEECRFSCATDYTNQMDGIFLGPTYALDTGSNHFACLRNVVRQNRISNFRDGIVLGRHSQTKTVSEPAGGGSGSYVGGDCYENTIGPRNYLAGEDTVSAAARFGIAVHYYNTSGYTTQNKPYANLIYGNSIDQTTNSATSISGTIAVSGTTVTGTSTAFTTELPNDLSSGIGRYLAIRADDNVGTEQKMEISSIDSATQLTLVSSYSGGTLSGQAVDQVMSGVGIFLASTGHSNVVFGNFIDEWAFAIRLTSTCEGTEVFGNYSAGQPYEHVRDASDPGDMNFLRHVSASGSDLISNFPSLGLKGPTELTIAGGVISATRSYHTVDTEGDAASDDLDTINAAYDGQIVVIRPANTARTVVLKDGTGNLQLEADITLDSLATTATLIYDEVQGVWFCIGRSA